jgi:hypothetical protein
VITEYSLSKEPLAIERALSECIRSETHSKAGFRLPRGLACSNPSQVLSNDLLSHLKCAKAWLYYSLEPTLATTFSGAVAGDGGTK